MSLNQSALALCSCSCTCWLMFMGWKLRTVVPLLFKWCAELGLKGTKRGVLIELYETIFPYITFNKHNSLDMTKPTKWVCAQRRLISAWASGCPGWSESSLGAHSFCWLCHVAAHNICLSDCIVLKFNACDDRTSIWNYSEITFLGFSSVSIRMMYQSLKSSAN